ncbi:hypothetical protein PSH58_09305 [Pseudomonas hefeiensis]|uniref:Restriction endonuclease n=1 Tax=Pseudomonas hefeiensis TaxID=2738125 RepID=A0ABY9GGB3_9PSED|nr:MULTISPECIES: hypothetical protein [unclassified Pseudomonas]WLH14485.1 hypothetical protein PSH57_09300 [Pseudomonas sp. FP205]WLH97545.1 hypothetical protein PSH58_09305 [Pseudomonas sp. FP53]WLI41818.1 hypothetical protein PSH74_09290 [Pseudomonas sp. FP821]
MTELALDNLTIAQLRAMGPIIPGVELFFNRLLANTYEDFVKVFYKDLDAVLGGFQENPELLKKDGEDRLNTEIKRALRLLGYIATHDEKIGGHSDLVVRGKKDNFLWIGEAKIHAGYDYLYKGFQQLTTRYSTGDVNQDCGGMLIYIKNNDAASVMAAWRAHLASQALEGYIEAACNERPNFVFYSVHKHDRSGTPFKVKHIGVILGFDPKDKRAAKPKADKGAKKKATSS